jgi:hypothetical protein
MTTQRWITCMRARAHVRVALVDVTTAFSGAIISSVEFEAMLNDCSEPCRSFARARAGRHILPGGRQKIPPKYLKNNKKTAPGLPGLSVQRSEAAWDVCQRRWLESRG